MLSLHLSTILQLSPDVLQEVRRCQGLLCRGRFLGLVFALGYNKFLLELLDVVLEVAEFVLEVGVVVF